MARLLITGAAGRIGTALRTGLATEYTILRLTDRVSLGDAGPREELVQTDLGDREQVMSLCEGVDAIVHMAGIVNPTLSWDDALQNNIEPNYNIFEAARVNGVRRVVFASSIHAHGFVHRDEKLSPKMLFRPDSFYGLAKVVGEATGRLYADKHGLEVVCLRIASFRPEPTSDRELGTWLSPRDAVQLVKRSLDAIDIDFIALYGVSKNNRGLYDTSNWGQIGYHPEDDSGDYAEKISAEPAQPEPELERRFHGAHYVSPGFSTDFD